MFLKLCRQSGGQSLMHTRVVGGHGRGALPTTVDGLHLPAPKYNNIQKSRMLSMNAVCRPPHNSRARTWVKLAKQARRGVFEQEIGSCSIVLRDPASGLRSARASAPSPPGLDAACHVSELRSHGLEQGSGD